MTGIPEHKMELTRRHGLTTKVSFRKYNEYLSLAILTTAPIQQVSLSTNKEPTKRREATSIELIPISTI
ncbi:hypothetical protein SK128_024020, partial [Halocaridina rubra]